MCNLCWIIWFMTVIFFIFFLSFYSVASVCLRTTLQTFHAQCSSCTRKLKCTTYLFSLYTRWHWEKNILWRWFFFCFFLFITECAQSWNYTDALLMAWKRKTKKKKEIVFVFRQLRFQMYWVPPSLSRARDKFSLSPFYYFIIFTVFFFHSWK